MFENAALLPLTTGFLLGILFSRFRLRRLMLLTHHIPYRFWRPYDELYDAAGIKFAYEAVDDGSSKTQVAFLSDYHRLQHQARSRFKSLWNTFAWQVGCDYGLALTISLAFFWGHYTIFVVPFVLVQATYFAYVHFYKQYRLDFFAILMIRLMFSRATPKAL